jgi:hypothetical protein
MSITHNLENLTNKQKSDLELAQMLVNNLNSLKPLPNYQNNTLSFDGEKFKVDGFGFSHEFLVSDIYLAIENSYSNHREFILDTFQKEVNSYLSSNKSKTDLENLKDNTIRLLKYYGFNSDITYPLYSDELDFKNILENINNSINSLFE